MDFRRPPGVPQLRPSVVGGPRCRSRLADLGSRADFIGPGKGPRSAKAGAAAGRSTALRARSGWKEMAGPNMAGGSSSLWGCPCSVLLVSIFVDGGRAGEVMPGRIWIVVEVELVVGNGEGVRGSATAREKSQLLNNKTSTGSPVEVASVRQHDRGRHIGLRTVGNP